MINKIKNNWKITLLGTIASIGLLKIVYKIGLKLGG